jgi:hypothetical protein
MKLTHGRWSCQSVAADRDRRASFSRPVEPLYQAVGLRVVGCRGLEMNTQDSDEDALFRQEMRYPERGAEASPVSDEPVQGRAEPLRLCNSWMCRSI